MNFVEAEAKTIKLNPGDPGFTINDNLCLVQRAAVEFSEDCPYSHQLLILQAINKGWIKPVAYIKKSEHVFDMLERS